MDRGEREHGSTRSERHKIKRTDDFDQGGGVGKRNDKEKGIWNEYLLSDLGHRTAVRKWIQESRYKVKKKNNKKREFSLGV